MRNSRLGKFPISTIIYSIAMQANKIQLYTYDFIDKPLKQMLSRRSQTEKRAYNIQFHVY